MSSQPAEFAVPVPPPAPVGDSGRWARRAYDTVVILLASWLAVLTATAEAFFTPFRLFGTLVPVAALAAVVVTPLLSLACFRLTGRRGTSLIPVGLWMFVALWWSQGGDGGDVVLASTNWVAMAYLLAGSASAAFGAYRVLLSPRLPV